MMNTTPKISIIVPIYNAGLRLKKCLDTLVNQTFSDIEIILVLDCPTDGSDKLAKEYAKQDERIVIVENKKNLHIGESRNRGLSVAKGEYIGFSDHDDYRELTMYEELYREAKTSGCEILLGNMALVGDRYLLNNYPDVPTNQLKKIALTNLLEGGDDKTQTIYAVNIQPNIYKKDFLDQYCINFVDTRKITPEDLIFQIKCLFHAQNISLYQPHLYYHTVHKNNTGESEEYVNYRVTTLGKNEIYNFLIQQKVYDKYEKYFLKSVKKLFSDTLSHELIKTKSLKKFIIGVRFMKSFPFTKKAFRDSKFPFGAHLRFFGKTIRRIIYAIMKY